MVRIYLDQDLDVITGGTNLRERVSISLCGPSVAH